MSLWQKYGKMVVGTVIGLILGILGMKLSDVTPHIDDTPTSRSAPAE